MKSPMDKLPPHSSECELAVLGCVLLDQKLAVEVNPDWFYDLRNKMVAEKMVDMACEGKPINTKSIFAECKSIGDIAILISQAMDATPTAYDFPYWKAKLIDYFGMREIIRISTETCGKAYESQYDEFPAVIDDYERDVLQIRKTVSGEEITECNKKEVAQALTMDYELAAGSGIPLGIPSGFSDLDRLIHGFKDSELTYVAARPSVGKTSLALNIIEKISIDTATPTAAGMFSLEMPCKQLFHRMTCSLGRVDGHKLEEGQCCEEDITKVTMALGKILSSPFYVIDKAGMTIPKLVGAARRMMHSRKIKILLIDYLGLLKSGSRHPKKHDEIDEISKALKNLARELAIPVVVCCQLNRNAATQDRAPIMSDLRESGSLEEDADNIILLHRKNAQDDAANIEVDEIDVNVAKNRNGPTGRCTMMFVKKYTRFEQGSKIHPTQNPAYKKPYRD